MGVGRTRIKHVLTNSLALALFDPNLETVLILRPGGSPDAEIDNWGATTGGIHIKSLDPRVEEVRPN